MNQSAMLAEFVRRCDVDVVMCAGRLTLLDQSAARDLLPLALRRDVAVVVAGVYNSGLLAADRPREGATYDYAAASPELVARANRLADLCEAHGVSLPEAALAYPLRHRAVASVVVGCRNEAQVRSAADRHAAAIPEALWRDLAAAGVLSPADSA
jgi:D-threo-aldose 1-dehydrogenase